MNRIEQCEAYGTAVGRAIALGALVRADGTADRERAAHKAEAEVRSGPFGASSPWSRREEAAFRAACDEAAFTIASDAILEAERAARIAENAARAARQRADRLADRLEHLTDPGNADESWYEAAALGGAAHGMVALCPA